MPLAILKVFVGWYIIVLVSGLYFYDYALMYRVSFAVLFFIISMTALTGTAAMMGFNIFETDISEFFKRLKAHHRNHMDVSIGDAPEIQFYIQKTDEIGAKRVRIKRKPLDKSQNEIPKPLQPFFRWYQKEHPRYARLMMAGIEIMLANKDCPATCHKKGHGGANLFNHSFNVLAMMIKEIEAWKYTGHKNKKGDVFFGLIDKNAQSHKFSKNDPLPYLAAFLHDIGKIVCYQLNESKNYIEVTVDHDTVGSKMLRLLPEFEALPIDEQQRLLTVIGYYHKIHLLPVNNRIDDRARSAIELLYFVDLLTGQAEQEGRGIGVTAEVNDVAVPEVETEQVADGNPSPIKKDEVVVRPKEKPIQNEKPAPKKEDVKPAYKTDIQLDDDDIPVKKKKTDDIDDLDFLTSLDDEGKSTIQPKSPPKQQVSTKVINPWDDDEVVIPASPIEEKIVKPYVSKATDDSLKFTQDEINERIEIVKTLFAEDGRVNGKTREKRIASKYGNWLYIFDASLRKALSEQNYPWASELEANNGNASVFTKTFCLWLEHQNAIYRLHGGNLYPTSRCLFEIGNPDAESSKFGGVIIAKARALDIYETKDASYLPIIRRCMWPSSTVKSFDQDEIEAVKARQADVGKGNNKVLDQKRKMQEISAKSLLDDGELIDFNTEQLGACQIHFPDKSITSSNSSGDRMFLADAVDKLGMKPPGPVEMVGATRYYLMVRKGVKK